MASLFDNDDDDFDFTPSTSSNLSSLFGSFTSPQTADSTSNLKYKAPKQPMLKTGNDDVDASKERKPKTQGTPQENKSYSRVMFAKVVTLWKVESNKKTSNIGKHIIAIIGCTNQNQFETIIYKEKNNILIRKALNETTIFYKYDNNFMSFYDNQNQFWSISFETHNDLEVFSSEIVKNKGTVADKTNKPTSTMPSPNTEVVPKVNLNNLEQPKNEICSNDSDSSLSKTRANILSRITKMGQQILPQNPKLRANTSTEMSDSDFEETALKKPATTPRKLKKSPQKIEQKTTPPSQTEDISMWSPQVLPNINQNINHNQVALGSHYPQNYFHPQVMHDYGYSNLLAHNFELKANLNDINSKLNSLLNGNSNPHDNEENISLKSKIKVLNLKVDNLKADLEKSEINCAKLKQELDNKQAELEKRVANHQEYEVKDLKMKEYCERIENLVQTLSDANAELAKKDAIIDEKSNEIENLKDINVESRDKEKVLQEESQRLHQKITELQKTLEESKKNSAANTESRNNFEQIEKTVRQDMNDTFLQIMEHFEEDSSYNYKEIQSVVLKNLKRTSFTILDNIKNGNSEI